MAGGCCGIDMSPIGNTAGCYDASGGLATKVYIAPYCKFTSLKQAMRLGDPAATSNTDFVDVAGNHTFGGGDGFWEWSHLYKKAELKFSQPQTADGPKSGTATLELFFPGNESATLGSFKMATGQDCVILVEGADGVVYQMGTNQFQCSIKYDFGSGKGPDGELGTTVIFECPATSVQKYAGTITIHP